MCIAIYMIYRRAKKKKIYNISFNHDEMRRETGKPVKSKYLTDRKDLNEMSQDM